MISCCWVQRPIITPNPVDFALLSLMTDDVTRQILGWWAPHPGNTLLVLQHAAGGLGLGPVLGRLLDRLQSLQLLVYTLLPAKPHSEIVTYTQTPVAQYECCITRVTEGQQDLEPAQSARLRSQTKRQLLAPRLTVQDKTRSMQQGDWAASPHGSWLGSKGRMQACLSSCRYWLAKVAMASLRSQSFTLLCSRANASALSTLCIAVLWARSCTTAVIHITIKS